MTTPKGRVNIKARGPMNRLIGASMGAFVVFIFGSTIYKMKGSDVLDEADRRDAERLEMLKRN